MSGDHRQCGTDAHQHVRAQARRPFEPTAIHANDGPKHRGQQQADGNFLIRDQSKDLAGVNVGAGEKPAVTLHCT